MELSERRDFKVSPRRAAATDRDPRRRFREHFETTTRILDRKITPLHNLRLPVIRVFLILRNVVPLTVTPSPNNSLTRKQRN